MARQDAAPEAAKRQITVQVLKFQFFVTLKTNMQISRNTLNRSSESVSQFFSNFPEIFDFSKKLAAPAPNMHRTKYRRAQDLLVVKFSALYDPWRSKKHPKTTIVKIDSICQKRR